jgi:hypothetical protein
MSSPEVQQDRLDKIQIGREANAMRGILDPYVDQRIMTIVQGMVSAYRSRRLDHDFLVGSVAQITAYFDLMSDLDSQAKQGAIAAAKEMMGAEKTAN